MHNIVNLFSIIRLGKDSVPDIRKVDGLHGKPSMEIRLKVKCSQVPLEVTKDAFCLVWLGSDNNKGADTDWIKGLRAIGKVI